MLINDAGLVARKTARLRALPHIPETGWRPPVEFPNLSSAVAIGVDVEAKDPGLLDYGPFWGRNAGHIVGVSLSAVDRCGNRGAWYFPVRHEVEPEYNLQPCHVFTYLRDVLQTPNIPKIGANLIYDVGALTSEGIYVEGDLHDCQFAEALLSEDEYVALERLGQKYLNEGKETSTMYRWSADAYGGEPTGKQRGNIYRISPRLVGPYAESDADLPMRILEKQWPIMEAEGLLNVYRMECDLIYLLVRMRLAGVTVDVKAAEELHHRFGLDIAAKYAALSADTGERIDSVNKPKQLARVFDFYGVPYPKTPTGKPSFKKEWLEHLDNDIGRRINAIRELEKLRGTFIQSYILDSNVNGKLYCSFHPLRSDEGGTRSGRFSSANPNLQNIPSRSKTGKLIRNLFVPDDGHLCWEKNDYSQIEYRFLTHFCIGPGSDEVREQYNNDPTTDYHVFTQELVKAKTGMLIERKPIKSINFGLLYGMGLAKLSRQLGVDAEKAKEIFTAYHNGAPYVKKTMEAAARQAGNEGYVQTILGRRSRFNMWEPLDIDYDNRAKPLPEQQAIRCYGSRIRRAHTHKAVNRILQGSAADMMKFCMWRCWKDGVFDATGVPRLTVHDELDFSVIDDTPYRKEAHKEMRRLLETALPLRIPVRVDYERGPNWGELD